MKYLGAKMKCRNKKIYDINIWTRHGDNEDVHEFDPYEESDYKCQYCLCSPHDHGYIKIDEKEIVVCPGDLIISYKGCIINIYNSDEFDQIFEIL